MGAREVLRLLAPSFLGSVVLCVVGFVLVAHHHRAVGLVLVLVGAAAGVFVRMRLMMRGGGPRR
jgi:hypothetical protein